MPKRSQPPRPCPAILTLAYPAMRNCVRPVNHPGLHETPGYTWAALRDGPGCLGRQRGSTWQVA